MTVLQRNEKRPFGGVFLFSPQFLLGAGWLTNVISWLLPNHYIPWLNFPSEVMAFGSLALLMAGSLLATHRVGVQWPATAIWTLSFALIPWIQWVCGISLFAGDAILASSYLISTALAMVVGSQLREARGGKTVVALMHTLWIAAMLSAMVGLLQWLHLEDMLGVFAVHTDIGDPVMGNLGQSNQLGTLLLIGLVAYTYVYEQRVIGGTTFILGIAFMTMILVMTHSRAAMVGLFTVGCFLLVKRTRMNSRLGALQILAWMLAFLGLNVLSPLLDQALLIGTNSEPLFTVNGRMQIWMQTLEGIKQSPWTGYGWNQTFTAIFVGAETYPGTLIASFAHNVLLDLLAWNGVPIGLTLIVLGGYWFCTRAFSVTGLTGTYAFACLLPFTLHSMVELPFAYAYFLLSAGLLIGVVESTIATSRTVRVSRSWVALTLFVGLVVGGGIVHEYFQIEEDVRVTRFENLNVGTTESVYSIPEIVLLTQMATLQRASRQRPTPQMTALQLEDMRRAAMRFPSGGNTLRYALALALNDDPSNAQHIMRVLRGVYGEQFYESAKHVWRQTAEQYPVLKSVDLTK